MKSKLRKRRTLRAGPRRIGRRSMSPPKRETRETGVLVGGVHDPAEKAADRAAGEVMAGHKVTSLAPATAAVHRACADCEEEKKDKREKPAQRSAKGAPSVAAGAKAGRASVGASAAIRGMGAGKPLPRNDRAFFEPRLGRDLSGVRIHDGPAADRAARSINARAFAWGSDIAFAAGERERGGAHLLTHELAHVVAGDESARRMVRRATIATTDGPNAVNFKKVPAGHRKEVQRALNIVTRVLSTKKCRDYFEDNCTPTLGAAETARANFEAATVYFAPGNTLGLSELPHSIGYNETTLKAGRWDIAATLIHELFHTCDKDDLGEVLAEGATEACGFYSPVLSTPLADEVYVGDMTTITGMQLGPRNDANHYILMGGAKIGTYARWEQAAGERANIVVEFKVPETLLRPGTVERKVGIVAVNHGFKSDAKIVTVHARE